MKPLTRNTTLIDGFISNPVKVTVGVILAVLFGALTVVPPSIMPSPIRAPVQLTPNLDQPIVTVTTVWQGASPEEIERELIDPQEEQLKSLQNLTKINSSATEGTSNITMEFAVEADIDVARQDVSDALRRVQYQIPQNEFDNPIVIAGSARGGGEIAWMILRSERKGVDVTKMADFIEDKVKPVLERVEGVATTKIFGGREREIHVIVDPLKLAAAGITFRDLESALRTQNTNISAGNSPQGKRDVFIRTIGQFTTLDDIRETVITITDGGPIRVGDVADVEDDFKNQTGFVRSTGDYVLAMPAYRKTNSNVIEVMEGLRAAIKQVNEEVLAPKGLAMDLTQVYDETDYIYSAIGLVQDNVIYGGILAIVILMLFLRSISATFVVGISIPIAIMATLLVIPLTDRSINVVMLAGLAFAVGMVVDNAIVVLENIYRHQEMGKTRWQAASDGASEVWGAVLANSLTTMIVFLPILFVAEEAGQLFRDIAIAIAAAVGLSMIVSIVVIPPLAARILGGAKSKMSDEGSSRFSRTVHDLVAWINVGTARRLLVVFGFTLVSIFGSLWLAPKPSYLPSGNRNLIFGILLVPPGYSVNEFQKMGQRIEEGQMDAPNPADRAPGIRRFWEAARGTPEERAAKYEVLLRDWNEFVENRKIPELEGVLAQIQSPDYLEQQRNVIKENKAALATMTEADARAKQKSLITELEASLDAIPERVAETQREIKQWRQPPPAIENFFFVAFDGGCFMGCTSADPNVVAPLTNVLSLSASIVPDTMAFFFQQSIFGNLGSGNSVDIEVRGDDLAQVSHAASMLQLGVMAELGPAAYPQPDPTNFNRGRLETRLIPDRVRAGDVGLNVADIGFIVRAGVFGSIVGQYREGGESYDLSVRIKDTLDLANARSETAALADVPIATPIGRIVPLSHVSRIEEVLAPQQINHIETQRAVMLTVRPPPGKPLGEVLSTIESVVDQMRGTGYIMPPQFGGFPAHISKDVIIRNSGNASKLRTTWDSLKWLLALSGLIVYLLMAGLFESFVYPFVIILTVPLAIVGGFLGLSLVHAYTWYDVTAAIQELDMLTILGFVILLGVVVNNGILIVHQSLNFAAEGMSMQAAIPEAVRTRIRPIFMTTLTTLFGQLPLVIRPGAGAELYRGLGAVVLGGLIVSTIFTLIVVPAVLSLFVSLREQLGSGSRGPSAGETVTQSQRADSPVAVGAN